MQKLQHDQESSWLKFRCSACDCMNSLCNPGLMLKWAKIDDNSDDLSANDIEYSEDEDDHMGSDTKLEGETTEPEAVKQFQAEASNRQYVSSEDFRIVVGTWNVAGNTPPAYLKVHDWLELKDPADIYILGFQEIVALDVRNVLLAENKEPVIKWQGIIHQALNEVNQTDHSNFGNCPSCSREQIFEDSCTVMGDAEYLETTFTPPELNIATPERAASNIEPNFHEAYKGTEHIDSRSVRTKSEVPDPAEDRGSVEETALFAPLLSHISRTTSPSIKAAVKKHVKYICIASRQMVGIYITVWVHRKLRKFIQSVAVCHVGLGLMGCLGNKGSVAVSMTLHQTRLCFICSHLSSGNKEGDEFRRNNDVMQTLKRMCFYPTKAVGVETPNTIWGHDCIIWFGDFNYRLSLPDNKIRFLVGREDWQALLRKDQLRNAFLESQIFEGWHEGSIAFAPTYKYDIKSGHYAGENVEHGEKTKPPAWCDRILWYGKGLKQLSYRRHESALSDHKPVTAVFLAEVEVLMKCKV